MVAFTSVNYGVADVAALVAIASTDLTEGAALLLADDGNGKKVWCQYKAGATNGDYRPSDSPATGYWMRVGQTLHRDVSGAFNATPGSIHAVSTGAGAATATMPASPLNGDVCKFVDADGSDPATPSGFGLNALTIQAGAGHTIQDYSSIVLDKENAAIELVFSAADSRWNFSGGLPGLIGGGGGGAAAPGLSAPVIDTSTSRELTLDDLGKTIVMSNVAENTINIPLNSAVAFEPGSFLFAVRDDAKTIIRPADGATLNGLGRYDDQVYINPQGGQVKLWQQAADNWRAFGDVATETSDLSSILQNLIAWWSLDEASGDRLSDHPGGPDLIETGTISSVAGKIGNGANNWNNLAPNYLQTLSTALMFGDEDVYFSVWVNFSSVSSGRVLFGKYNFDGGTRSYLVQLASGSIRFVVSSNGSSSSSTLNHSLTLSASTWYFIEVYHDSVNDLIGVAVNNGAFETLAYSSGLFQSSEPFRLGMYGNLNGGGSLQGTLDELLVRKQLPTQTERDYLWNSGNGRSYPG